MMDIVVTTLRHRDLQAELRHHSFGNSRRNSVSRRRRVHAPSSEPALKFKGDPHLVRIDSTRSTDNMGSSPSYRYLDDSSSRSLHRQEGRPDIMHHWMKDCLQKATSHRA